MRTVGLCLLTVILTSLAESRHDHTFRSKRIKREQILSRSKRRWVLSTIEIQEEDPGPYPKITTQMFNDKINRIGKQHKFRISGMGVTEEPLGVFSINEENGVVYAHKPVDREKYSLFHIKFDILDKDTGVPIDKELAFDVEVKDINDNAPRFRHKVMKASVKENVPEGYLPVQLYAWDIDQANTTNSQITISLLSQEPKEPKMSLEQDGNSRMAQLKFVGCFNYDKANKYTLIVEAKDHGVPQLSSTATVFVHIVNMNSHLPQFKERTYSGEIMEMETKPVLRVGVEDKDTEKTPGWRARYYFIKGNEDGNYKLETDPETNEGILTVVKPKDYERTTLTNIQIGVENEEAFHFCATDGEKAPLPDTVNVTIKVVDVNDPPEFDRTNVNVYQKEEEPPGTLLHQPTVYDVDSDLSKIRYVILEDEADWMAIDEKTGELRTAKKMDRESPLVNDNIYKVVIGAIDDGQPPATGTCTIFIHLGDVNDNAPSLVHKSVQICGDKGDKVIVPADDPDDPPFTRPFTFHFDTEDKQIEERWKLDVAIGDAATLITKKAVSYGNHTIPLIIQDQQGKTAKENLEVIVCDCENSETCRGKLPLSSNIGVPGIGLIIAGLLLFLLLLLVILCQCGGKDFVHIPFMQDEGNQTLIKYNQEGGGSECKSEPTYFLTTTDTAAGATMGGATKQDIGQVSSTMTREMDMYNYNSSHHEQMTANMNSLGRQQQGGNQGMMSQNYYTWTTNRMNGYQQNGSMRYLGHDGRRSNQRIMDFIERRITAIDEMPVDHPAYMPIEYANEGHGSISTSLEALSINTVDDLQFLNDLGPRFKTLGGICQQTCQEKHIQL